MSRPDPLPGVQTPLQGAGRRQAHTPGRRAGRPVGGHLAGARGRSVLYPFGRLPGGRYNAATDTPGRRVVARPAPLWPLAVLAVLAAIVVLRWLT